VAGESLYEKILDLLFNALSDICTNGIGRSINCVDIEVIVAVDTGDLLDDICLHSNILGGSPGRNGYGEGGAFERDTKAESRESGENMLIGDLDTCIAVYEGTVKGEGDFGVLISLLVGEGGNDLCLGISILHDLDKTSDCGGSHFGVKALLVTLRSIGSVSKTNCCLTNRNCVKGSALEGELGGVINDLGIKSAHNTRDANGDIAVADHKHILVDVTLNAVKGLEGELMVISLDAELFNLARIECVHGLSHLEHNVVGNVGEEVDGAHATVVEADTHINRAYLAGDVLNLEAGISLAEAILDLHINCGKIRILVKVCAIKRLELSACNSGKLARDTVVTPKVGAVGEGLVVNLEDDIVDVKESLDIGTDCERRIEDHKTVVVIADTEFLLGAAHTVGGKACELTGSDGDITDLRAELCEGNLEAYGYVGSAANNVNEFCLADVNLKKMELL
jgi:hypothetical protein